MACTSEMPSDIFNHAGCPYTNQLGEQAVQNWAGVLAAIDPETLPPQLQAELLILLASNTPGELRARA